MKLYPLVMLTLGLSLAACDDKGGKDSGGTDGADGGDGDDGDDGGDDGDDGGEDGGDDGTDPTLESLAFDQESLSLVRNETATISVTASWDDGSTSDETAGCAFTVDDEAVASVDAGTITGLAEGSTTIDCEIDGISASLPVDVRTLSVSGDVTLLGWGVGEVEIWVAENGGEGALATTTSLTDGSFTVDGLGLGSYEVVAWRLGSRFGPPRHTLEIESADDLPASIHYTQYGQGYPREDDGGTNHDAASAEALVLDGALLLRSIWPHGQEDWYSLSLTEGQEVEIFTANLSANTDTILYLYDTDGVTELDNNDDCWLTSGLDSCLSFSASATGTYYIKVAPLEEGAGVSQYNLGAISWMDADEDGFGTFFDCDDSNPDVYIEASGDEAADGIDYDCNGVVRGPAEDLDPVDAAGTDENTTPRTAALTHNNPWDYLYASNNPALQYATLHDSSDVDRYAIEVPAWGYYSLTDGDFIWNDEGPDDNEVDWDVYESDGVTELSPDIYGDFAMVNDTSSPVTYYLEATLESFADPVVYAVPLVDYGMDMDQDGYYTQDWGQNRDCDDTDSSIQSACYP